MKGDSDNLVQVKTCTKCGETKPVTGFYTSKSRHGKIGLRADCKDCVKTASARWASENPERKAELVARYRVEHAGELKEYLTEWRNNNPDKVRASGMAWYESNKEKAAAYSAEWARKNPAKHKASQAKWYQNNKQKVMEAHEEWRRENPEKMREYANRHARKRSQNPRYRFEAAVKQSVRRGLTPGSKIGRRTFEILGFTAEELRAHLEKQFLPGMSWENYGEWHIDHKVPLSAFNYETPDDIDFKPCWALSNLQPLWAPDNLSKKDKLEQPFQPSLLLATNDNRSPRKKETT